MSDRPTSKYQRVLAMIIDDGTTWNLSDKDRDALRHVLGLIHSLANDIAEQVGLPIPTILKHHEKAVESGEFQ